MGPSMLWALFAAFVAAGPLSIVGSMFSLGGNPVFLNGINQAWHSYGNDFGNNQGSANLAYLTGVLDQVKSAGGNSIRIWLHISGAHTPQFDTNGLVTAPDSSGTLISDMKAYMDAAASRGILVFWVLWNGAALDSDAVVGLVTVDAKLDSYLAKGLTPMVTALKGHVALGGWDVMNEPEGAVTPGITDANSCWDTTVLGGTGAWWVGQRWTMQQVQRFVAKHARTIHTVDPTALVTVGSWSERSFTDKFGWKNYYSDACLQAFGDSIDFAQIHTYSYNGAWSSSSPFLKLATDFGLSKPLVIGEFAAVASGPGMTSQAMYQYAKNNGYAGGWGWQEAGGENSDSIATLLGGMAGITNTYPGGTFAPTPPTPLSKPAQPNTSDAARILPIFLVSALAQLLF